MDITEIAGNVWIESKALVFPTCFSEGLPQEL